MPLVQSLRAFADPQIAARAGLVVLGTAGVGAVLLIARTAAGRGSATRRMLLPAAQSGYVYLLIGLTCRFIVQHHRSRLQIAILLAAVAVIEAARAGRGSGSLRLLTWLLGSMAVCTGVLAAKWALEPNALSRAMAIWDDEF